MEEAVQLTKSQIEDIGLAATKMHGFSRRGHSDTNVFEVL